MAAALEDAADGRAGHIFCGGDSATFACPALDADTQAIVASAVSRAASAASQFLGAGRAAKAEIADALTITGADTMAGAVEGTGDG